MSRQSHLGACCASLIFLFLYAAASKLFNLSQFTYDMHNQAFKQHWIKDFLIVFIPASEILICIALFIDRTRRAGLIASLVLMMLFTLYTFLVLIHTFPRVPCSCGGIIRKLTWPQHLAFNLFFVGVAAYGLWLNRKIRKQPSNVAFT